MHVEDQVDRFVPFDDARHQHARQEALARAAFAEDPHRTLHQPLQVEVDLRHFQFQRRADVEVRLVLRSEDRVHILHRGVKHLREVAGNGLDGFRLPVLNREHRRDIDDAVHRRTHVDRFQKRVAGQFRRVILDAGVGAVEADVVQHAEEARVVRAMHHHVTPHRQIFYRLPAIQLDHQPLAERSAHHHAEA
ncbi:MAG: hypothetical protein R3E39_28740 [Anaerolineae bacterium]